MKKSLSMYNEFEREVLLTKLSIRILSFFTDRVPKYNVNEIINKKAERFEKRLKHIDDKDYKTMIEKSIRSDGYGKIFLEDPSISEVCYVVKMADDLGYHVCNVDERICQNECDRSEEWNIYSVEVCKK